MSDLKDLEMLAKSYAIDFADKGNGHIQLSGHGIMVNYYPLSKNRTVFYNGKTVKHCTNWDAVKICLNESKQGLGMKKKDIPKNRPSFSLETIKTNPAGIKHTYKGSIPPWEFEDFIYCEPDRLRVEALKLKDLALSMEVEE